MKLIGLDFDNTLIDYNESFHKIAAKKQIITGNEVKKDKVSVRDYLNSTGRKEEFTRIQGEVYGKEILMAQQMEGMMEALKKQMGEETKLVIVSHKTKKPISGEEYNLHNAAKEWMRKNRFFDEEGLRLEERDVYFEETKEKKLERIHMLKCDYFIDDLAEIIDNLSENTRGILFTNNRYKPRANRVYCCMAHWNELEAIMGMSR